MWETLCIGKQLQFLFVIDISQASHAAKQQKCKGHASGYIKFWIRINTNNKNNNTESTG